MDMNTKKSIDDCFLNVVRGMIVNPTEVIVSPSGEALALIVKSADTKIIIPSR